MGIIKPSNNDVIGQLNREADQLNAREKEVLLKFEMMKKDGRWSNN